MKILHDPDAQADFKIRTLRHRYGAAGYGNFWSLVEVLAKNNGTLDLNSEDALAVVAEFLQMPPSEAERFIADCVRFGLFRKDNGTLISDRLVRDRQAYEQRKAQCKEAAKVRWDKVREKTIIYPCPEERRDKYRQEKEARMIARWEEELKNDPDLQARIAQEKRREARAQALEKKRKPERKDA